ncbi:hypothetical protein [Streptomyces sp. URMC 129]|uniref:hypothetical protein n=1 Tax=Streptomyces sp. URMC 129 TaxID=3423407 RepID=UPI003F195FB2
MSGGGHTELETLVRQTAATAARRVPGVAFLRPGLTDRLRGAGAGRASRSVAGVRATRRPGGGWDVTVHLATLHGHRALDVTRAVRAAVTAAVAEAVGDPGCPVRVTVTVTGLA